MNKIPAILKFVRERTSPFHASLLHEGLELQVKAAPDGGERITREYKGHTWHGWSDDGGKTVWKNIRIPYGSADVPDYQDTPLGWSLEEHAEGVGYSGWNWRDRASEFFVYDLDSVANHAANALTDAEMAEVERALLAVPYASVVKSKSAKGRHVFVVLDKPVPSANHNEHAARAHAVLGVLSALTGRDLRGDADCYGRIAWFTHRDTADGGFALVREGAKFPAEKVPQDWKQYLDVVSRKKPRTVVPGAASQSHEFQGLVRDLRRTPLDEDHVRLLRWFESQDSKTMWSWSPDLWLLQAHTSDLARAHRELGLEGIFHTVSTGKNRPDQNCWAVPIPIGGWQVRRFGKGAADHPSWTQDRSGWTRCDFNVPATPEVVAAVHGGVRADGRWVFETLDACVKALLDLGFEMDPKDIALFAARKAELKETPSLLVASFPADKRDPKPSGAWATSRNGKRWMREFRYEERGAAMEAPDNEVRAIVSGDTLWTFSARTADGAWMNMSKGDAITFLKGTYDGQTAEEMVSVAMHEPWRLVSKPFRPEYAGGREWNRYGARLAFEPQPGPHPTWDKMFQHLGGSLDQAVDANAWCKKNGVSTGAEYLRLWCASLFQFPTESLPYLFLHSRTEQTGKSSLHEALELLFKDRKGYVRAKDALTSSSGFNGALSGAVLCVVEEVDLHKNREAYARIKDWTTGKHIEIRALYENPRTEPNNTHWIQCANSAGACPVQVGDTRITMIHVQPLTDMESRKTWRKNLEAEAPAILATLLGTALPEPDERLQIPALATESKQDQALANRTSLETFWAERLEPCPGAVVNYREFYDKFVGSLEQHERPYWTRRRVGSDLPPQFPRGKYGPKNDYHIGNVRWRGDHQTPGAPVQRTGEQLRSTGRSESEPAVQPLASVGKTEGATDVAA